MSSLSCALDKPVSGNQTLIEAALETALQTRDWRSVAEFLQATPTGLYAAKLDGTLTFADGSTFSGQTSLRFDGQVLNARGTPTLASSATQPKPGSVPPAPDLLDTIEGRWEAGGHFAGRKGRVTLMDGSHYKGALGGGGSLHGQGAITWRNQACYVGAFHDGHLQGPDLLTWPGVKPIEGIFHRTPMPYVVCGDIVGYYSAYGVYSGESGAHHAVCDVASGNGAGVRFWFDAQGQPDAQTLIRLG